MTYQRVVPELRAFLRAARGGEVAEQGSLESARDVMSTYEAGLRCAAWRVTPEGAHR